jgi:hypothetical protein
MGKSSSKIGFDDLRMRKLQGEFGEFLDGGYLKMTSC